MTQDISDDVLNEAEAASFLRISRSTLRQGRCDGQLPNRMAVPPFYRLGRRVVYLKADLLAWVRGNAGITGMSPGAEVHGEALHG